MAQAPPQTARVTLPEEAVLAGTGLSREEYRTICTALGRAPNLLELRCFSILWSEHCSYKHSRAVLRRLPTQASGVLQGPGENAGVVEIGSGWALVWKMESHNHPSAVDPYNGAATGVGGIIRDVLSMGARPIALLDSLRFGLLDDPRARRLLAGVVAGIAGYGNSIGVPTVGGELATDPAYADNPLLNVACLGLVRADRLVRGRADPPGAVLLYAGARTGRDGIGGAAFASDVLDARAEHDDRAAVQIGDPFAGKCLVEATLEALATGRVLGMQDMGAGGLTCAAAEMGARAGRGVMLDLNRVPRRERDMMPHEVLLSESQERMLLVMAPEDVESVGAVFQRWGLQAAAVGRVTDDGRFRVTAGDEHVVDLPAGLLTAAPLRRVEPRTPADRPSSPMDEDDPTEALLRLLAAPEVASKAPIYEQYDHMVQVRTVVRPGRGAAVLRLPEAPPLGIAMTVDGNGRWCAVDPYGGALAVVVEAAANLACAGATPLAVTDCLNFASPEDGEVFGAFAQAVEGIADACRAFGVPVVGGNVSFYNEGPGGPILPTPVIAMAGLVPDATGRAAEPREGDRLVLLGGRGAGLGGSLYARRLHGVLASGFCRPDLAAARRTLDCVRAVVRRGLVSLAHDLSDGGLATALAECCLLTDRGAAVTLPSVDAVALFGEGGPRVLCAVSPEHLGELETLAATHGVPVSTLGFLRGRRLRIAGGPGHSGVNVPLTALRRAWTSLARELS